jgi:hypothetical protein
MTDQENNEPLSRAEVRALRIAEAKSRVKERAKAAKAAYLERPDVKARIAQQKEALRQKQAARRRDMAAARKAAKKTEKAALSEAKSMTRARKQAARDQELTTMLSKASELPELPEAATSVRPQLKIIQGGRSIES